MKFKTTILFFIIILFIFSCRKSNNDDVPSITISKPYANQQFNALDTVWITMTVEDKTQLQQISVTLLDSAKSPVISTVSITPHSNNVTVTIPYPLNNINLSTGIHYLWVNASNGTNTNDAYRSIFINGVPEQLNYIYIITPGNSTSINLLRKTPSGSLQQLFGINGDFSSSATSSRFQLMYTCGMIYGNLNVYNVSDNSEAWSVPIISDPPFPYFENIGCYNNILYASFYNGYIKGYNNTGLQTLTAIDPTGSYPVKTFADNTYLYADHAMYSGSSRIFGVYYLASGALKQRIATNYEVVEMFSLDDDDVFVFANQSGQGIIMLYSVSGNGTWQPKTLPTGKINDVVQVDANDYIIAHTNGLYKYQYNTSSLISYVSGINASSVKYDVVSSEVYAATGKQINLYDYTSGSLVNTITAPDTVLGFQLVYNK